MRLTTRPAFFAWDRMRFIALLFPFVAFHLPLQNRELRQSRPPRRCTMETLMPATATFCTHHRRI